MPTKQDRNSHEIVQALRAAGATARFIQGSHGQGGVPDLLVGFLGVTYLLEIKVAKTGRLSTAQQYFMSTWTGGPVTVVHNALEALAAIGLHGVDSDGAPAA